MKDGQTYKDQYGFLWVLKCPSNPGHIYYDEWVVWNKYYGWGVWDNGKGLTLLAN